ncbi:MAG: hypothetical protein EA395_02555 [Phormidium sp. GEM2.Bin31]|nr:MAG: hypothetical protein EA395_02555 [Phormidium sp. GEM2.Bin31]
MGIGAAFGNAFRRESILARYEQHRPQIKTGDVIGFSGNTGFSDVIKWGTGSMYSHVGIVLTASMGGGFGDSVLVVEATTETSHQVASKGGKELIKGVQMNWLSKRTLMYDGSVWWFPLKEPLSPEGRSKMEAWLRETHSQRVPYDNIQVLGAGIKLWERLGLSGREDLSRLFCSELVTKALRVAGVVDPEINPSRQTPADVINFPCLDHPVLLKGDSTPVQ